MDKGQKQAEAILLMIDNKSKAQYMYKCEEASS